MIDKVYDDRVLIEKISPSSLTEQGYIIPESSMEESLVGTVAYIGDKVEKTSIGDVVVFEQYEYKEVIIEGETLVLTKEESLICKLKKNV